MASRPDNAVRIDGLRDLDRSLKRLQPEVQREFRKEERAIGKRLAVEAQARAVKGTGAYARSLRPFVTAKGVSVGSTLPQAGVLHFGGTIRPRGVPITFKPRPVVSDALDRRTNEIVDALGDAVDTAARKVGWR